MSRMILPAATTGVVLYLLWDRVYRTQWLPHKQNYKLIYTVPPNNLSATKEAIFAVGGGQYPDGKYIDVLFPYLITDSLTHMKLGII